MSKFNYSQHNKMSHKLALVGHEPEQLRHTLNIISLTEHSHVVGSAKYMAHKYPGDIDVFEQTISKSGKEQAGAEFAILISNVAKMISIDNTITLMDFKAGEDVRFMFKEDDELTKVQNADRLTAFIKNLCDQKLITKDEAVKIANKGYDDAREVFKRLANPHWTLGEIIVGQKVLRGGKTLTLMEAVMTNARVKLDTVTWFSSRLQAVEIVYLMGYTNPDGSTETFFDMGDYQTGIIKDINMYKFDNPLKTMKRLWSLSVYLDCDKLIEDLVPVFSSDAAALSQVRADIEVLTALKQPVDKMMLEALELRRRLQNHLDPQQFHKEILHEMNCVCDKIYHIWQVYKKTGSFDYKGFRTHLKWLDKFLQPIINQKAQPFYEAIKHSNHYCVNTKQLLF